MQKIKLLIAALGSLTALPVLAADAPATHTVTSNVSLTSNYLYRGISQTGHKPAIQGGFDYAHASGFYAGAWGSSISWLSDAGVAANAGLELDTYLGYKSSFAPDFTYDVGYLRYNYPGTYATGATKANTDEIYGAVGYKWVTVKYYYSLGDTFGVADAQGSNYWDLSASYPLADSGITLGAHYGKQGYKGSSAAYQAGIATGNPNYSDYKLSVTRDFTGFVVGVAVSKTDAPAGGFYTSPQGKDLGKGSIVASVSRVF
jgi:uncharacterized protein (TIGR02001 family)